MPRSTTRLALALLLTAIGAVLAAPSLFAQEPEGGLAYSIELSGTIDPATEGWIEQALEEADGLIDSMRAVLAVVIGVGLIFVVRKIQQARRNPVRTGWEELVGAEAVVREPLDPVGQVFVQGALWRARPPAEQGPIGAGDRVLVESVDGLTLNVSRLGSGGEDADSEAGPKGAEA